MELMCGSTRSIWRTHSKVAARSATSFGLGAMTWGVTGYLMRLLGIEAL